VVSGVWHNCQTPRIKKEKFMKKILLIFVLLVPVVLAACSHTCETEPIVEENHKLIVPPHFGARPAK
jgi:hypothetical protein